MQFRDKLTPEETSRYRLPQSQYFEWYWITVDAEDLRQNIHIYINSPGSRGQPIGWQIFSSKTCLGDFAKAIVNTNFQFGELQQHFDQIRNIAEKLDYARLTEETLWQYFANDKRGPFMIVESVHRQIATYIHYFLWHTEKAFKPLDGAVCALPKDIVGDFAKIPESYCK